MRPSKAVEGAKAEVLEVEHPASTPQNTAECAIEPFGRAIAGTAYKVVGDGVQPSLQGLAEFAQGFAPQLECRADPVAQFVGASRGSRNAVVVEDRP